MIAIILLALLPSAAPPDVAVVCPAEYRDALGPWAELRREQGHRLAWVDSGPSAEAIHGRLKSLHAASALSHVVLVGDVPEARDSGRVPTHYVPAKINVRWGSEPEIASDHPYADLNGDGEPDAAIGRISVQSVAQLQRVVGKILSYERDADFGPWRRDLHFVAGVGGFGAIADRAIEAAAKKLITDGVPAGYRTSMTYASWQSPYCPPPDEFADRTRETLSAKSLCWVYIGHGHVRQLDELHAPGQRDYPILFDRDVTQITAQHPGPIACLLACYTGAFDARVDCLGEQLLRSPSGPVAVYAGSRVTMPYAMASMSCELLDEMFAPSADASPRTLGHVMLRAKRRMQADSTDENRKSLDSLAALVSPAPRDLAGERREHTYLFNLLGDPLLRIPSPQPATITFSRDAQPADAERAGATLDATINSPIPGTAIVELVLRRDRQRGTTPLRAAADLDQLANNPARSSWQNAFATANNQLLAAQSLAVQAGPNRVQLRIPADASGPCHVRVWVSGRGDCAVGACDLRVSR